MGVVYWIVVGLIAGWLAGQVMKGGGYGVIVDIILGILGGLLGGWIFGKLGIWPGGGMIGSIIVAFVGRLHPLGIVLSSLLMSLLYLGGEAAQINLALPSAVTGLFQGTLLSFLLAADVLVNFRLRVARPTPAALERMRPIPAGKVA